MHGLSPAYLYAFLPPLVGENVQYNLRNHSDLVAPICRLEAYKNSFLLSTISMWNSLPIEVRNVTNVNTFKNLVRVKTNQKPNHLYYG